MDRSTGDDGIGLRVRRARHSIGLKQEEVAGRIGKTKAWLSKIENGLLPLEKRSDIAALAEVLGVSADTLLGEPAPEIQPGRRPWNLQPLRGVLLDASPDDPPDVPARPVPELAQLNADADAALRWSDYDKLQRDLPVLIGELEVQGATAGATERDEALRLLVPACASAVIMLRYAGQPDLAWVAAERGRQAAALLGDPVWQAAAAFGAAHARSSTNLPRALLVTPRIADELEPCVDGSPFARDVYGMMRLSAALACAVQGDHAGAADQSAEAARVAATVEDRPDAWELFGPSNAGVWRTSLAVEAGDAGKALAIATTVNPRALASGNRRAALRIERARALSMLGKNAEAITELHLAEKLSPAQVHNTPLIREMVRHMLDQARREAGGRELRGLAWRMGLI